MTKRLMPYGSPQLASLVAKQGGGDKVSRPDFRLLPYGDGGAVHLAAKVGVKLDDRAGRRRTVIRRNKR